MLETVTVMDVSKLIVVETVTVMNVSKLIVVETVTVMNVSKLIVYKAKKNLIDIYFMHTTRFWKTFIGYAHVRKQQLCILQQIILSNFRYGCISGI